MVVGDVYVIFAKYKSSEKAKNTNSAKVKEDTIMDSPHVQALSVPRRIKTPLSEGFVTLDKEERHAMEFHLRRMWALNLVQNMRDGQGWDWDGIAEVTGKSRQTWNNVCLSKFSSLTELNHSDPEIKADSRDGFRPVSNGFIRNVTDKIATYNWTVFTQHFRSVFDLGLVVICPGPQIRSMEGLPSGAVDRWTLERIGDTTKSVGKDFWHYKRGRAVDQWIKEKDEDEMIVSFVKGKTSPDSEGPILYKYAGGGFPLLDCYDPQWGQHNCWEAHVHVEELVFEVDDETGEPDPRAKELHAMWDSARDYEENLKDYPEPPKPKDPEAYRVKPKRTVLKKEDVAIPEGKSEKEKAVMALVGQKLSDDLANAHARRMEEMEATFKNLGYNWEEARTWIETGLRGDVVVDPSDPDLILKSADGSKKAIEVKVHKDMEEMGFFPSIHLPFDVHPKWIGENGNGQVEFKVKISFRAGVKSGHAIEVSETNIPSYTPPTSDPTASHALGA